MQIPEEDYKIRMVKSPSYEGESRFIIMDKLRPFDKNNGSYALGCCLYNGKSGANGKTIRDGKRAFNELFLRHRRNDPVGRTIEDTFEIPTLEEYNKFMTLLRMNGFSYNRKKGELKKDGIAF